MAEYLRKGAEQLGDVRAVRKMKMKLHENEETSRSGSHLDYRCSIALSAQLGELHLVYLAGRLCPQIDWKGGRRLIG
jgi:hypothetical protein